MPAEEVASTHMKWARFRYTVVGQLLTSPPPKGELRRSLEALRLVFGTQVTRTQRRSDGTVTLEGVRFEVPSALRNLDRLLLRYARWDLAFVHAIDPRTDEVVARLFPLDRSRSAHGRRKKIAEGALPPVEVHREDRSAWRPRPPRASSGLFRPSSILERALGRGCRRLP